MDNDEWWSGIGSTRYNLADGKIESEKAGVAPIRTTHIVHGQDQERGSEFMREKVASCSTYISWCSQDVSCFPSCSTKPRRSWKLRSTRS